MAFSGAQISRLPGRDRPHASRTPAGLHAFRATMRRSAGQVTDEGRGRKARRRSEASGVSVIETHPQLAETRHCRCPGFDPYSVSKDGCATNPRAKIDL